MGRCVAANCSREKGIFKWPKDPILSKKWTQFVKQKRVWDGPSSESWLCYLHFEDKYLENKRAYEMNFAKCIRKTPDAIPTIHSPADEPAFSKRDRKMIIKSLLSTEDTQPELPDNTPSKPECLENHPGILNTMEHGEENSKTMISTSVQVTPIHTNSATQTDVHDYSDAYQPIQDQDYGHDEDDIDVDDDDDDDAQFMEVDDDPDWLPQNESIMKDDNEDDMDSDKNFEEMKDDSDLHYQKQAKYIVFQSSLIKLLAVCTFCGSPNKVYKKTRGTLLTVKTACQNEKCGYQSEKWHNQPFIRNIPVLNVLLSAAIVFTGSLQSKSLRLLRFMGVQCITSWTFFKHQKKLIHNVVLNSWTVSKEAIFSSLKQQNTELLLAGDGRCDSMGHSAKFGIYTLLELKINKILTMSLQQSGDTKGSTKMELAGLKECKKDVDEFKIEAIITDRHTSIAKWIRENWKIPHFFDCWHVVKGMGKKLAKLAKKKGNECIQAWIKCLKCHLYWCAMSSAHGDQESIKKKWISMTKHIKDDHTDCLHKPLDEKERNEKYWFKAGSIQYDKLTEIVTKKRFVNNVGMMSSYGQTSSIEAFHAIVNHFAPKMIGFGEESMRTRVLLAALHYNENAGRVQRTTKAGKLQYSLAYPRSKPGEYTVKKILVDCTYEYVDNLFDLLWNEVKTKAKDRVSIVPKSKPSLASYCERPNKEEAVAAEISRFNKVQQIVNLPTQNQLPKNTQEIPKSIENKVQAAKKRRGRPSKKSSSVPQASNPKRGRPSKKTQSTVSLAQGKTKSQSKKKKVC